VTIGSILDRRPQRKHPRQQDSASPSPKELGLVRPLNTQAKLETDVKALTKASLVPRRRRPARDEAEGRWRVADPEGNEMVIVSQAF
jgi:hypothetical protein